jgi:cell division protein FtsQ
MWNSARLLDAIADALYALAALLVLYGALVAAARLPAFALREVHVSGPVRHVTRADLERALAGIEGNFFTVDLAAVRAALERLPWVRRAEVRRRWPDRLEVILEEHRPLARWEGGGLVSALGELFRGERAGELPLFGGPEEAVKEIAIQYEYFRGALAAIGERPVEVRLSARGAWRLKLAGGAWLELGRERVEQRIARFVAAYERALAPLGWRLEHVDLRYANGFAVRVPRAAAAPREGV